MMKYSFSRGQEATEFVLIAVLVFFASLITVMIFGKQLVGFFTEKSSAVKVAQGNPSNNLINKNYNNEYTYMGAIQQPIQTIVNSDGTENLIVNGISINNIPSSTSQAIKTTGSSGVTDNLVKSLESLIARLDTLSSSDPNISVLANKARELANEGYLVADSEEWFEAAAQRLTSNSTITMPPDNRICEFGEITNGSVSSVPGCDNQVASQNFIYSTTGNANINNMLTTHLQNFQDLSQQLQSQSASLSSQEAKDIMNIINILSGQIQSIAVNVKSSVDINNQSITGLDDLNNNVASKTTDIKSQIIENTASQLDSNATSP